MEYCHGHESPALPITVNENENTVYDPKVYQGVYQSDINNPSASSSGVDKGKAPYIDLNQSLSDEDEYN